MPGIPQEAADRSLDLVLRWRQTLLPTPVGADRTEAPRRTALFREWQEPFQSKDLGSTVPHVRLPLAHARGDGGPDRRGSRCNTASFRPVRTQPVPLPLRLESATPVPRSDW